MIGLEIKPRPPSFFTAATTAYIQKEVGKSRKFVKMHYFIEQ
jgi:hypothetical protein